jgi:3-hydroxyacyl-[acyl-carrier protein] dehydratase/trans-2-decenoyl-[acyl-carrier protein] isomerase
MVGFYLGWLGRPGRGRALGVGEVKFFGMIVPTVKKLEYIVNIKKLITRNLTLGIADGELLADGERVYSAESLKVGLFQ